MSVRRFYVEPPIASITSVDVLVSSNRGTRRSRSIHPGKWRAMKPT